MNIHTKETIQDTISLLGNLIVLFLITYLVFFKGISAWWLLTVFIYKFRYTPIEYLLRPDREAAEKLANDIEQMIVDNQYEPSERGAGTMTREDTQKDITEAIIDFAKNC
jgi:hypothetical protein